jgi:hypothetical protein
VRTRPLDGLCPVAEPRRSWRRKTRKARGGIIGPGPSQAQYHTALSSFFMLLPWKHPLGLCLERQSRGLRRGIRALLAHPGRQTSQMLRNVGYLGATLAKHILFLLSTRRQQSQREQYTAYSEQVMHNPSTGIMPYAHRYLIYASPFQGVPGHNPVFVQGTARKPGLASP